PAAPRAQAQRRWRRRGGSLEAPPSHDAGRPKHQEQDQERERHGHGVFGSEEQGGVAFNDAERQAADHHAGHAAQSAETADPEGLARGGLGGFGRDRKHDAEQAAGGARHGGTQPEGDGINAADLDAHQLRRLAVHAHGDDCAPDARAAQQRIEETDQRERKRHADQPIDRQDDAGEIHRAERRRQDDFAKVRLERENHQVVEQEVKAESQRQRDEYGAAHDEVDEGELDGVAEAEQQHRGDRHEQERIDVQVLVGEERGVGSEDDQGSVQEIDDVENAPDQREPDRDAAL